MLTGFDLTGEVRRGRAVAKEFLPVWIEEAQRTALGWAGGLQSGDQIVEIRPGG